MWYSIPDKPKRPKPDTMVHRMEFEHIGFSLTTMFAINLVAFLNLSKTPSMLPLYLLFRGIVSETVMNPYPSRDGHTALLVREDVSKERWDAIVKIVRTKIPKRELLLYQKDKRWKTV